MSTHMSIHVIDVDPQNFGRIVPPSYPGASSVLFLAFQDRGVDQDVSISFGARTDEQRRLFADLLEEYARTLREESKVIQWP